MTEPVWVSAHVFRHDDLDPLLLSHIAPLMAELVADGLVRAFFCLRYWEGGPHVRLRMRTDAAHADEAGRRVAERLGAHLRAHPSARAMDPDGYARIAAEFAALEGRPGYERRLYPPDTVHLIPYQPEHASFGHGPSLDAVERHFCESTAVALDVLRTDPPRRVSAAMAMTLATLLSFPPAAEHPGHDPTAALMREPWSRASAAGEAEAAWLRSRDELAAMAGRLRAADPYAAPGGPVHAWLRSVRALRDRLIALRLEGAFSSGFPRPVTYALNRCLHLHLNRLGVSLAQEARLRHLAVLTIRDTDRTRTDAPT